MCNRVLWMEHGRVRMSGPAGRVVRAYKDSVSPASSSAAA